MTREPHPTELATSNGVAAEEEAQPDSGDDTVAEPNNEGTLTPVPLCDPPDLLEDVTAIMRRVSQMRQRPLFVLAARRIDEWVPQEVYRWRKQLKEVGKGDNLDVLIHSPGGVLTACYQTARLFAQYTDDWEALVPAMAASGATLICLGSSNIVMPHIAQLGALDPQVQSKRPSKFFSVERQSPLEAFRTVQYVREFALTTLDASMTYLVGEQSVAPQTALDTASKLAVELARPILEKIEPYDLGSFALDSSLAMEYCDRISRPREGRKQTQSSAKYRELVERYPAHEFLIDTSEAAALGLNASEPSEDLEELFDELRPYLWKVRAYVGLVTEQGGQT